MQEKWNEFVYELLEAKNKNAEESEYHFIIESQLKLLGWLKFKGEICHKTNIPIGNNNFIQPDILIKKDGEDMFVIEVKRPVHTLTDRERQQLGSYMRQLKLTIGLYIGDHIEIFYDKPDAKEIISVFSVKLESNTKDGEKFVSLFDRGRYDQAEIHKFCEEQIAKQKEKENLDRLRDRLLAEGESIIAESLKQYLAFKYDDAISEDKIEEMLSSLTFSISLKGNNPVIENTYIPTPESEYKKEESQTNKGGYDYTKYKLNGSYPMGKNEFVLAVVKAFLRDHPEKTYRELENIFKPQLQKNGNRIDDPKTSYGQGVIRSLEYIKQRGYDDRRYHDEILFSSDKVPFKVCTQWGIGNIGNILELARRLGYKVEEMV